jgi:DNA-binding transcriptional LysR family regulator
MLDIDEIALRRLDLTVLLVFLGLMRHRKAVDVAAHMGLTQSAISHSIKRLRDIFDDPLFLRRPAGMEPTAVAIALEPKIRRAVETLSEALTTETQFDPTAEAGVIQIGAYDNEMATLVPGLLQRARAAAPGLRFAIRSLGRQAALAALEAGELDLALGFIWDLPDRFQADPIHEEGYAVVMRADHPLTGANWGLEAFCAADHLVVSPAGDLTGVVDQALERIGRARRVAASVPLFFPALATVASSDMIATLPGRLVAAHAARFGLVIRQPPLTIRPFTVAAIRHQRNAKSAKHDWLLAMLTAE